MLFCIDYCMWIFFGLMIYLSIGSLGSGKSKEFVSGYEWIEPRFLELKMELESRHGR